MRGMLSPRSPFDRLSPRRVAFGDRVSGKERIPLRERPLDANGAGHGLARGAKGDHEAVADSLYCAAPVLLHLLPNELFVGPQGGARGLVAPAGGQVGRALDVGEEDSYGALGERLFSHGGLAPWGVGASQP